MSCTDSSAEGACASVSDTGRPGTHVSPAMERRHEQAGLEGTESEEDFPEPAARATVNRVHEHRPCPRLSASRIAGPQAGYPVENFYPARAGQPLLLRPRLASLQLSCLPSPFPILIYGRHGQKDTEKHPEGSPPSGQSRTARDKSIFRSRAGRPALRRPVLREIVP